MPFIHFSSSSLFPDHFANPPQFVKLNSSSNFWPWKKVLIKFHCWKKNKVLKRVNGYPKMFYLSYNLELLYLSKSYYRFWCNFWSLSETAFLRITIKLPWNRLFSSVELIISFYHLFSTVIISSVIPQYHCVVLDVIEMQPFAEVLSCTGLSTQTQLFPHNSSLNFNFGEIFSILLWYWWQPS